jgi:hypothetical protein
VLYKNWADAALLLCTRTLTRTITATAEAQQSLIGLHKALETQIIKFIDAATHAL